jgi:hypothetical protein
VLQCFVPQAIGGKSVLSLWFSDQVRGLPVGRGLLGAPRNAGLSLAVQRNQQVMIVVSGDQ